MGWFSCFCSDGFFGYRIGLEMASYAAESICKGVAGRGAGMAVQLTRFRK